MSHMTTAISASGLVKSFGRTRALDGLDLSVRSSEVHGFLGPNGAGKTTTLHILLGLLRADAGSAQLLGATVVGRQAALSAALIVTFAANLVAGVLVAGGLMSIGLPAGGSIALGLSAAAVGWVFTALAGVAAQVMQSAGAARAILGVIIGLTYLMRIAGDGSGSSWLSWLSPLERLRASCPQIQH